VDEMRLLIREVLSEELLKLRPEMASAAPRGTEEVIAIRSSADLNAFAQKLLGMAQDGRIRAEIIEGRHQFRLSQDGAAPVMAHQPMAPTANAPIPAQFSKGMVSERDVSALPKGTRSIKAGALVKFTPLARDEMRRRGIKVERTTS
jgi:hypothetical protein